jgi:hypothetical protein
MVALTAEADGQVVCWVVVKTMGWLEQRAEDIVVETHIYVSPEFPDLEGGQGTYCNPLLLCDVMQGSPNSYC